MNTRQQILDAAQRIYQAHGLARLTTKEIAREAGVAEGTLYKHFATKGDLLLAAVREHLPDLAAVVDETQAGQQTVQTSLVGIAHELLRYFDALVPMTAALFGDQELLERQRQAMRAVNGGPHRLFQRVAAYIEAEQRLGRLDRRQKALGIATPLIGACFHYVFLRQFVGTDPLARSEKQFVDDLVETLLHGAAPKATSATRKRARRLRRQD